MCRCDDGSDYAIKENEIDPSTSNVIYTAHNEYFCYRLSQMVGISCPNYHFVTLQTGEIAFGSRWESGNQPDRWWMRLYNNSIPKNEVLPTLARIYAFDLFVFNTDRHANNYLIRQQHFGHAAIAFDYSRAWTYHGFPVPQLPMPPTSNTVMLQRQLSRLLGAYVDEAATTEILDRIESVSIGFIEDILNSQPPDWLTKSVCQDILAWWASPDKNARISSIRAGIKSGAYL